MFGRTSRNFAVTLLAASAILVGCSDAPTPTAPGSELKPNLALGDNEGATAEFGKIKVCKSATSNVSGVFTVSRVGIGGSTGTVLANPSLAPGACAVVALDGSGANVGSTVTITETSAGLVSISGTRIDLVGGTTPTTTAISPDFLNGGSLFLNSFHGYALTFDNFVEPPSDGCTYTKGWYRNNGSSTVVGYDGRTKAQAQAIFKATPGKPGTVTFGGNNTLLNLYQQFLAALENLGGDLTGGPDAVDDAIDAVADGTGGGGTAITTSLTPTEMSGWIAVLSAFNEGTYAGWPHCDD